MGEGLSTMFETEHARQSACKDPQSILIQYQVGPGADHGSAPWVLGRALGNHLLAQLSDFNSPPDSSSGSSSCRRARSLPVHGHWAPRWALM